MIAMKELEWYRSKLVGLLRRLDAKRAQLRMETCHHMDDEPAGALAQPTLETMDLTAARQEEDVSLGMLENEDHLFTEVNAALARMEKRTFGRCESCGHVIPIARLRAIPYARHCVACAEVSERKTS